jgi:hypothetical protein
LPVCASCWLWAACFSSAAVQRCRKRVAAGAGSVATGRYLLVRLQRCSVTLNGDPGPARVRGYCQRCKKAIHSFTGK